MDLRETERGLLGPSGLPVVSAWDIAIGHPAGSVPLPRQPAQVESNPAHALRDALRPALQEPVRTRKSTHRAPTDNEFLPTVPETVEINENPPRPEHEGPMEIQLVPRRAFQRNPLVEPTVKAGSWLRQPTDETGRHEDTHGSVNVRRGDEDVEIDERPQRRLRVVQVCDRGALEDPGLNGGRGQQVDNGD